MPKQDLGLRDAAVFDGWVLPPLPPAEEPEQAALPEAEVQEEATPPEERPPVTALPSFHHRRLP